MFLQPIAHSQDQEIGERILKACRKYGIQDERLSLLLLRDPDLTLTDNRFEGTALYWASRKNRPSTVSLLLEAGAGIEDADYFGNTSLMAAAHRGNLEVTEMLLQYDPNAYAQNNNGEIAIQMAEEGGHNQVVELLQEFMASNPQDISPEVKKKNPSMAGVLAANKFLKFKRGKNEGLKRPSKATLSAIIKAKILLKKKVNKNNVVPTIGIKKDKVKEESKDNLKKIIKINLFIGSGGSRKELTEAIEKIRKIKKELGLPDSEFEDDINALKKARGRANWGTLRNKGLNLANASNAFSDEGKKNQDKSALVKLNVLKNIIGAGIKAKNTNDGLKEEKKERVKVKIKAINSLLDIGKKKKEEKEEREVRINSALQKVKALKRFRYGGAAFRRKILEIEKQEKEDLIKALAETNRRLKKEKDDKKAEGSKTLIVINNFIFGNDGSRTKYSEAIDKIRKLQKDLNLPHEDIEDDINSLKDKRGKANWGTLKKKGMALSNSLGAFKQAGESHREKRAKELNEAGKNKLVVLKALLGAGLRAKNNQDLLKKESLDRAQVKINAIKALLSEGEDRREDREDRRVRLKGAMEKIKALKRFINGGMNFRNKINEIKKIEGLELKKAEKKAEERRKREEIERKKKEKILRDKIHTVTNSAGKGYPMSIDNPRKYDCEVKKLHSGKWVVFVKGFKVRGLKEVGRSQAKWFVNTSGSSLRSGRNCSIPSCSDHPVYHPRKRNNTLFFNNRTLNVGNDKPKFLQFYFGSDGGRIINVPLANCVVKNR